MSKNITDRLRYAYEAYCRGDIEGTVDTIDVDIEDFIVQIKLRSIHHLCIDIGEFFLLCATRCHLKHVSRDVGGEGPSGWSHQTRREQALERSPVWRVV
jgi:hypothetical protein